MINEIEQIPMVAFSLRFYGDRFDPDEITTRLEISPTQQYRPGDPLTKDGKGRSRHSGWRLRVGPRATWSGQDLIQDFRDAIEVPGDLVKRVSTDLNVEATIYCEVSVKQAESTPALEFSPDFLIWVADLGASLNVDVLL